MEQPSMAQMKIRTTESKREYLQEMEEMCERWVRQLQARELDIRIKEMHAHMIGTELEEKEEEIREREEALKKSEEELVICEQELQK
jgi:uncharacterized protein (DUF3084 family)